jgi:alpha-tubulin suppressor-like RCC1 family protein
MDFANQRRMLAKALIVAALLMALVWTGVAGAVGRAATKAPTVTQAPVGMTVEEGESASFEAKASGEPTPTVQWEISTSGGKTWGNLEGATTDRVTIASTRVSENGYEYRAVFTNSAGKVTSREATLLVRKVPVVTQQPLNTTVEEGQSATFAAAASGSPAPTVQWEVSTNGGSTWYQVSGGTADRLTIPEAKTSENGFLYRAAFTNVVGKATSETATLSVHKAPAVTQQPLGTIAEEGNGASFEAAASGFPAPTVQWEVSTNGGSTWYQVSGGTADRLTIADVTVSDNGFRYRAVFQNVAGKAISNAATLTVENRPELTEQPADATVEVGHEAAFEAAASGFPAPSVQWELSTNEGSSWSPVPGATTDELTVAAPTASENGDEYRAVFTNDAGSADSTPALLTVATHRYLAFGWGANASGQVGDGGVEQADTPQLVSGLSFVTAVAGGARHSLALLADGTVMAWGGNEFGQLGDGEETASFLPVPVEGLKDVKAIAAGANFSLALLRNGTVMAWGGNEYGQLGDGSMEEAEGPVAVRGLTEATAIAAGGEHALALLASGKVMAWGEGEHGQLGDGKGRSSDVPVAVYGLTDATAIAAGGLHSLAVLGDGTVKAWGGDGFGQLANSSVEEEGEEGEKRSEMPVSVEGVSGATAVAAGAHHSLALLSNGTIMGWGEDKYGELGNGSTSREEAPVAVSRLSGVSAISAGGEHSLALLSNGTVMAWGEDKFGELGDGSAGESSDVPVAVSGLSQIQGISAGGAHDLAFGEGVPTVLGVSPAVGPLTGNTTVTITGTDFTGATAVRFGTIAAKSFTVESPTSITAVSPAGVRGAVDVTVTVPAGTSPTGPADRFTYLAAPSITRVAPKTGPKTGGTIVAITGKELSGATAVSFGATAARIVAVNSATSITAEAPPGAVGTVSVSVTTPGGTSAGNAHSKFKYKK